MATFNTDQLLGSDDFYSVHEDAKRYTLRDNGFSETKNGLFQYDRVLSLNAGDKKAPKLKITISKSIDELKLSAVTSNGLKKVNLYKEGKLEESREFAENLLTSLVEENVLKKV